MQLMNHWKIERVPGYDNHELVSFFYDQDTGLRGFIAIHNTNLGPATGGTRYWHYGSEAAALEDVLKLSRAMTYKCALARLPYGGGKAVIMADKKRPKNEKFLFAYAQKINLFNGRFYTGEDMGMNEEDIRILSHSSSFIVGRPGVAGDPSPWAALSVYRSIEVGLKFIFGGAKIAGRAFAIKGAGKVGLELCHLLYEEGGKIFISDINHRALKKAKQLYPGIAIVSPDDIHKQPVDVYAPCALGGELGKKTIAQLRCKMVCGSANNQLVSTEDGRRLCKKDILYIPDFVANAGGLINVKAELHRLGYDRKRVEKNIDRVGATVRQIIQLARRRKIPTDQVATELAEDIFLKHHTA